MKKRNSFFVFMLSLIPGAGHMYLGLIRQGLQLMSICFGTIAAAVTIAVITNDGFGAMLLFLLPMIFFYSIFDALAKNQIPENADSLSNPDEEDIMLLKWIMPKTKGFSTHVSKVLAWVLIVLGGYYMLTNVVFGSLRSAFPWEGYTRTNELINSIETSVSQGLVALLLIFVGIMLLRATGRKKAEEDQDNG